MDAPSKHQNVLRKANVASLPPTPHHTPRRRPVEQSQLTKMGSRLLARSAAARLLSYLRRRTPDPTHRLLPHGTSLASLLGPTGDIPAAADSALLRYSARWSSSSTTAVAEVPMTADGLTVESIAGKGGRSSPRPRATGAATPPPSRSPSSSLRSASRFNSHTTPLLVLFRRVKFELRSIVAI